ncbi:MAG TPA: WS/DGAT domain-containing protein, partial [Acidimicrobiales bacterium]|nr:WS/DGAT domain-containing protein [Acidimicrobiales bacterium]
ARDDRGMAVGDGTFDNRISALFVQLPVQVADPVDRLEAIVVQTDGLKQSHQALAGERIVELTGFAPPALLALAGRLGTRVAQRTVNTLTTNVPGPQLPLYACGRRMVTAHPYAPLGAQMRLATAIFSYDGRVSFGVTADWDSSRDLAVLTDGIRAGIDELLAAATAQPTDEVVVELRAVRAAKGLPAPV